MNTRGHTSLISLIGTALAVTLASQAASAATLHVSPSGSHTAPYDSWATAAVDIQTAVNAANPGDTVLVTNGIYVLTAQLSITKGVTIRGLNGADATIVDGHQAFCCVLMSHTDAVLDGFTVRRGRNTGGFGGGVNIVNGGTVQNCVLRDSVARDGGGVAIDNAGLVVNCLIRDNVASNNATTGYGGGVRLLNGGTVRGCLVVGNESRNYGGGVNIWSTGLVENCTIVDNTAPNGAGIRTRNASRVVNTIIYNNVGLDWQVNGSGYSFTNCCTPGAGALPGSGNIPDDPQFVNLAAGNLRMQAASPCMDAGINQAWMTTAVDLDGRPRIADLAVDMGAYEMPAVGIVVTPTAGLVTTEAGGTASFSVVLAGPPSADVTIGVATSDDTEGTPSVASLTFTAGNWNVPQTVTATGADDIVADGDAAYTILTAAAVSGDPNYDGMDAADVSLTNTDIPLTDLSVTMTVNEPLPVEGQTVIFHIVAANAGPHTASSVALTDMLPAGLTFAGQSASQGSYDAGTGLWTVGALAAGASATLDLSATIGAGTAGGAPINNTAAVSAVNEDEMPAGNNSSTAAVRVPLVDVSLSQVVSEVRPNEAQLISFTVTAANAGPDGATGIAVTDVLPAGVTFAGKSASKGSYDEGTGVWTVGALAAGGSATLTLTAVVDIGTAGGPDIVNAAAVTAVHEDESSAANNSASASIHVPLVDVQIGVTVSVPPDSAPNANEGDTVGFTVTVANAGPDYASSLSIRDLFPGYAMTSHSETLGAFHGTVWTVGRLDPGASATLAIQATVRAGTGGTSQTNTAVVATLHEKDAVPTDNGSAAAAYIELSDIEVEITGELSDYPEKWSIPLSKDSDYRVMVDNRTPSFHMWNVGQAGGTNVSKDWHYFAARFVRGTNVAGRHDLEFYVDGQMVASHNSGGTPVPGDGPFFLGSYLGSNAFYGGAIDEVRLSKSARSPEWIETAYNQQAAPSAFLAVGTQRAGTVWSFEKDLTVQASQVAGDLADFPVLVSIEDADILTVAAGGRVQSAQGWDIAFTLPDGTPLKHEVERYAGNEGRLVAWVNVPALSAAADTTIVMHYGQAGLTGPVNPAAEAWDADFVMVQHMEEVNGVLADSTAFGNDGTNAGARHVRGGQAGGAYAFDGINDTVAVPHAPSLVLTTNDYTIEGWFSRRLVPADAQLRIIVRNEGPDPADDVVVENWFAGLQYVSHFTEKGDFAGVSGLWNFGRIGVGECATNWILADATVTGAVSSTAEAMLAEQADHDSAHGNHAANEDDQASVTLRGPPEPPGNPDFIVTEIVLNPAAPAKGGTFSATVTVMNQGEKTGNAGVLKLWVNRFAGALPADAADRTTAVGPMAAGATRTVAVPGLFTAPATDGTYHFRAFVDGAGVTAEKSEGNNQKTVTYTLTSPGPGPAERPDFEVVSIDVQPPTPAPGAALTVTVVSRNKGLAAGNAGLLKVWVNHAAAAGSAEAGDASILVGTLAVGAVQTNVFAGLTAPASGWCTFRAFIDGAGATVEQSEGNNQKTTTYGVQAAASWQKPDFVVTDATLTTPPTAGGAIGLNVTVINQGDIAGDAGMLKVWASHAAAALPAEAGDVAVAIGTLNPGQSRTLAVVGLLAPVAAGTHNVRAYADGADGTAEKSEGNNQKTATYTLAAAGGGGTPSWMKPDFEITVIDFSPAPVAAGAAFVAQVTVINKGDIAGEGGRLDVWMHSPAAQLAGATGNASVPVGALPVGGSTVLSIPLTAPASGWYTLRAYADSANITAEKSDGNNQKTKTYRVP